VRKAAGYPTDAVGSISRPVPLSPSLNLSDAI